MKMSRKKLLEKAQQLLALAASPNPEEARTSALLACQIMQKYGFSIVDLKPALKEKEEEEGEELGELFWAMRAQARARDLNKEYRKRAKEQKGEKT